MYKSKNPLSLVLAFYLLFAFDMVGSASIDGNADHTDGGRWATPTEYQKATGKRISQYNEAPELKAMVAKGALPPVKKRLPREPLVVSGFDERIGHYGGIIRNLALTPSPPEFNRNSVWMSGKTGYTTDAYPNLARSLEIADEEGKEWIVRLREGLKWSDGHPYTTDDILFWHENLVLNQEFSPAIPSFLKVGDDLIQFQKVDDYTIRIYAPNPFHLELNHYVQWQATSYPKHYLKQFHASYADKTKLDKMVKERGFDSWVQLLEDRADYDQTRNPDYPVLYPWMLVQAAPAPVIYRRNPYFWTIDEAGNQLPYIDEIRQVIVGSSEVYNLKHLAGEADWGVIGDLSMFPLLKKADQKGKIKIARWKDSEPNASQLVLNLTHKDLALKKIFQDKRFRFALSYALDRNMINELLYLGVCEPAQVAPTKESRFYHERLEKTAIAHDPEKASELLDEMGLSERDTKGYRLRSDGERLTINLLGFVMWGQYPEAETLGEIVCDILRDLDLDVTFRMLDTSLFRERTRANDYDGVLLGRTWGTNEGLYLGGEITHWVPLRKISYWGLGWVKWYNTKGKQGEKPLPAALEAIEAYKKARDAFDPKNQEFWFKRVLDIAADNLWTIGTVTKFGKGIMIFNAKMRNVPMTYTVWWRGDFGRPETYFYE